MNGLDLPRLPAVLRVPTCPVCGGSRTDPVVSLRTRERLAYCPGCDTWTTLAGALPAETLPAPWESARLRHPSAWVGGSSF